MSRNPTRARKSKVRRQIEFPDTLTPKQRVKYEAALKDIHHDTKRLMDEYDRGTKLTAQDYSVTINAR